MQNKPEMSQVDSVVPDANLIEELGEGGFKVVYKAQIGGHEEALKLVRIPRDPGDPTVEEENTRRIRREIEILGRCTSPYLVKLGGLPPTDCHIGGEGYLYYSEELVAGESLRGRIQAGHHPEQAELAELGVCLLSAIDELSGLNVIHRDIKPDNVLATGMNDRPYVLLDLGIAFIIGGTRLTPDSRAILGTLYYIAPEMLDANFRQSLDYRADLYTIALTLYEYASGTNPFARRGDPQYTTLYRIKRQQPPPLASLRQDLDVTFCRLIDQLLRKLPALRPANITELIRRMEGYR